MPPRIVLIGPADALPSLQERLDPSAEVQTFNDSEALEALDHIIQVKPALIALHGEFSETSRGLALINRIQADPTLKSCEVRVMAHDAAHKVKRSGHGNGAAVALADAKPALDQRGTRRAQRVRIKEGVDVAVDGNPAALVDLSAVGAQVVSPTILKPNQRVRIVMGDGKAAVKCSGAIAWASFEMPKGLPTRYRAGIDFGTATDHGHVDKFAQKHKKETKESKDK
ncbi:MAG TPA: PilZ domain-containing protein [Vicinamibacterales bacterium]